MKKLTTLFLFILLASSWQSFNVFTNLLTVRVAGEDSRVCYVGQAYDYDGSCTEPKATPFAYKHKKFIEQRAETLGGEAGQELLEKFGYAKISK